MKFVVPTLFLLLSAPIVRSVEPPKAEASERKESAPSKEAASTALLAGVEFNRLREQRAGFQKAATVEAALDQLAASPEPLHKALKKEALSEHRKEILTLLKLKKDGTLVGTPLLNNTVAGAHAATGEAKARRNAQNLVSTFCAAKAAGSLELKDVKYAEEAVSFVRVGIKGDGPFANSVFRVVLDDQEVKRAMPYVGFDVKKGLFYDKDAVVETNEEPAVEVAPDAVALIGRQLKLQAEMEAKRKAQ